jgi:RNA polymerase sigma factor (sigma-70 family)
MTTSLQPAARRRFEHAFRRLKPIERQVLTLSAKEGLGLADIALRLGITVEAVQRHLAGALCRLDRILERRDRRWWRRWWRSW